MQKHQIKRKTQLVKSARVGRGGKRGKTSGRGGKGQTARAGNKVRPEIRDMIKKIPKLRGRGKNINKPFKLKPAIINLGKLETAFQAGEVVSPKTLIEKGLIKKVGRNTPAVKILSVGEITKAINIQNCLFSKETKAKVEKVGGSIK